MFNKSTKERNMKTFEYKWKFKTVWQSEPYKKDTVKAQNIVEARKILNEKFYGFQPDPNCKFGGGSYKDSQEYLFDSLIEIKN